MRKNWKSINSCKRLQNVLTWSEDTKRLLMHCYFKIFFAVDILNEAKHKAYESLMTA